MPTFKIWLHVERIPDDPKRDDPVDLGDTGEWGPREVAHLMTQAAAEAFAEDLAGRKAEELLDGYVDHVVEAEILDN